MITIEILNENNISELQDLLMKCSDYLCFKMVNRDHSLVGVMDIVMRYAGPDILTLGLLVIEPALRGKGIGEKAEKLLEDWSRSKNFSRIRLGVLFGNDKGLRFWHKLGFKETGEIKSFLFHKFWALEKPI